MPCENIKTSSEIENVDWSTGTGSGHHHYANVRFGSGSSQASQSSGDICRICHCESDPQNPLLTPCYCAGSLKYVHQTCLQQWLTASETNSCELCKFPFIMHTKIKPFNEWRSLDISGIERRRLCCSVLFHCAAALCVIWSLCVLIERAADDVVRGLIDWPFWTKLAVVTVGLTGGVVFMYIQCKGYLHLCHRWKARNRILLIQNAPEKVHPLSPPSPSPSPAGNHRGRHAAANTIEPSRLLGVSGTANGAMGVDGVLDLANNVVPSASNAFNFPVYASSDGGRGVRGGRSDAETDGAAALHLLPASPHHLLQQGELEEHDAAHSSGHRTRHAHHLHHHHLHRLHHGHHQLELGQGTLPESGLVLGNEHDHDHDHELGLGLGLGLEHAHEHVHEQSYHFPAQQQIGQVAVSANIECSQSQHNYERDWALDDVVSQISSFRPCPQGSGSMTPFHDSIHNVLENSDNSSRVSVNDVCGGSRHDLSTGCASTDTGRDHCLQLSSYSGSEHKAPSIGSGVSSAVANGLGGFAYKPHAKRYSNSSIFMENRDILNDDDDGLSMRLEADVNSISAATAGAATRMDVGMAATPMSGMDSKINYRHSSILTPAECGDQFERLFGRDVRRYSDTRLLDSADCVDCAHNRMDAEARDRMRPGLDVTIDMSGVGVSAPLYRLRRSLDTVEGGGEETLPPGSVRCPEPPQVAPPMHKAHHAFKSLPNLSSSCESLLKK